MKSLRVASLFRHSAGRRPALREKQSSVAQGSRNHTFHCAHDEPLYGLGCQGSAVSLSRIVLAFLTRARNQWRTVIPRSEPTLGGIGCRRKESGPRQFLSWIARALQLAVPSPCRRPADAPYPYLTVGPDPRVASRDCDTSGVAAGCASINCLSQPARVSGQTDGGRQFPALSGIHSQVAASLPC